MLWSFQPPSKTLSSILGKSNLQFAGMSINLNISTSSLNLMTPDGKQVSGEHFCNRHIFFYVLKFCQILLLTDYSQPSHAIYLLCIRRRSCKLLPNPLLYWSNQCHYPAAYLYFGSVFKDTTDYVAYVAKDPVNRRGRSLSSICDLDATSSLKRILIVSACHILECSDGLAQDVISTIGQAFDLRFQQYLQCPSGKISSPHDRLGAHDLHVHGWKSAEANKNLFSTSNLHVAFCLPLVAVRTIAFLIRNQRSNVIYYTLVSLLVWPFVSL